MVFISTSSTLYELAPQSIELLFSFFENNEIESKYHPSRNEIMINSKIMSKILKYDGDMRKLPSKWDINFYSHLLSYIVKKVRFNGILVNCEYFAKKIEEGDKNNEMLVKIIRKEAR